MANNGQTTAAMMKMTMMTTADFLSVPVASRTVLAGFPSVPVESSGTSVSLILTYRTGNGALRDRYEPAGTVRYGPVFKSISNAFFRNIVNIGKLITDKQITRAFGIHGEDNDAKHNFPVIQAAPSFPSSFPHIFSGKENPRCLIPCAVDQDPYFRMTRDVAHKLGYHAPALIVSSFFPALQGETGKIPASDPNSAIYLTDSAKDIKKKVNRYAFSGGQDSVENHRKYGANLEVDIPIKYLSFFLDDEAKLEHIRTEYGAGRMLTGEVKMELIEVLTTFVETHRLARAKVTEEMVDAFMAVRPFPNKYA